MAARIALVSCVKTKATSKVPAKDMYLSPLFKGMRRYAEQNADAWYILSAEYGLLTPENVIDPYECTLNDMPKRERAAWAERVKPRLLEVLPAGAAVIILAGERHREGLVPFLEAHGFSVEIPMFGLPFGSQLGWLKEH